MLNVNSLKTSVWEAFDKIARTDFGRRLMWRAAEAAGADRMVVSTPHGKFMCSTADKMIGLNVLRQGSFCWYLTEKTSQHAIAYNGGAKPQTYIDIGANIGTNTIYSVRELGFTDAICFEPNKNNFYNLSQTVALNGLGASCQLHCLGLGDFAGEGTLSLSAVNFGDHQIILGSAETDTDSTEIVKMARFDDIVTPEQLRSVSLVSLDVQGYEGHVLAGAKSLLAADIPLACEVSPDQLAQAGGAEMFYHLVEGAYSWFEDLTTDEEPRPISELRHFAEKVGSYGEVMFYKRRPAPFAAYDNSLIMTGA